MLEGLTLWLPLVAVLLTTVSAVQTPQVEASEDSLYCSSYAVIVLPAPWVAPLHESVTAPSVSVALSEKVDGSPHGVIEHRMLALAFTAELTSSASIVVTPNCVYVPMTRDTVGVYVPLPAVCVSVVSVVHALQVALSVEVRLAIVNPLIALVPPAAPLHVSEIASVLYTAGVAVTAVGAVGRVFRRTELVETFQPE